MRQELRQALQLLPYLCCLSDGFSNRYLLDTEFLNVLHLNSPDYTILNWVAVLMNNRTFKIKTPVARRAMAYLTRNFSINVNAYDLITGYRANDSYSVMCCLKLQAKFMRQRRRRRLPAQESTGSAGLLHITNGTHPEATVKFFGCYPLRHCKVCTIRFMRQMFQNLQVLPMKKSENILRTQT